MEYSLIIALILFYFYTVTCAFFAGQIAASKGRRRHWCWLGILFGILGIVVVCFLPNAKGVKGDTNPIRSAFKKLSGISPLAVWIVIAGVLVVAGGALLGTKVTAALQNRSYEKELVLEEEGNILSPTEVQGAISDVFCGNGNQFAVTESGDLYGWGRLEIKPLEEGGAIYQKVRKACSAGDTVYVLMEDGTLYAKGNNKNSLIPGKKEKTVKDFVKIDTKVKDMALSATVGAYIKENGNLYVFGVNTYKQLGADKARINHANHRLAQKVSKVIVTARSLYYRLEDGSLYAVGNNAFGQFGLGNKKAYSSPVRIAKVCKDFTAGDDFTLLLMADGSVLSAGNNASGQLGRQTLEELEEARKEVETVTEEEEKEEPTAKKQSKFGAVELEEAPSAIGAGSHTAYALIGEKLYGWGDNAVGQLGIEGLEVRTPVLIHKTTAEFSAGGKCVLVITQGGKLQGAGDRRYAQLGDTSGRGFKEIAKVKEAKN